MQFPLLAGSRYGEETVEKRGHIMKLTRYFLPLLIGMPLLVQAGSDRLIMGVPLEVIQAKQLIHIQFIDNNGTPLGSNLLKQGKVMVGSCDTKPLVLGTDYKYGYFPSPKKVGIYLDSNVWRDREVCISLPGYAPVKERFGDDSIAHSLVRTVTKSE